MQRIRQWYAPVFISVLGVGLAAHSQIVGGTISGVVHDASGAALAGVNVTVRQTETGATRVITTDGQGRFFAPQSPSGPTRSVAMARLRPAGAERHLAPWARASRSTSTSASRPCSRRLRLLPMQPQ